jgi:hypothetical protein
MPSLLSSTLYIKRYAFSARKISQHQSESWPVLIRKSLSTSTSVQLVSAAPTIPSKSTNMRSAIV